MKTPIDAAATMRNVTTTRSALRLAQAAISKQDDRRSRFPIFIKGGVAAGRPAVFEKLLVPLKYVKEFCRRFERPSGGPDMMNRYLYCIVAGVLIASTASAAHIDSATSTLASTPGVGLINFEGKAEGQSIGSGVYAGVSFSQPDGGLPIIDNSPFLYGYSSSSGVGVLTGSTQGGAPFPTVAGLIASFSTGQSAVEAFLSDTAPLGTYTIKAFGLGSVLLDSFTISAPQRYVGFTSSSAAIYSVQFGPSSAFGDAFAIDDLRSVAGGTPSVPEPASWAMMLCGFGALGAMLRRRQRVGITFA